MVRSAVLSLAMLFALSTLGCPKAEAPPFAPTAPSVPPSAQLQTKLWDVPAFAFTDQNGKPFTQANLKGHVWIADYIFTRCTSACPVLTSKVKLVQRKLEGAGVRFLSFSVDPEHDDSAALKAYAAQWRLDDAVWLLLVPPDAATLKSFVAGMQTEVLKGDDAANPILHSESLLLIDGQGAVRGHYDSTSNEDLTQLVADARYLAGPGSPAAPAPSSAATDGHQLAEELGCIACHAQLATAPRLEEVAGSTVALGDGTTVLADPAYLRESILDPDKKVVRGYTATMPSYRGQLSDAQVDALVAFVGTLATPIKTAVPPRLATRDPVCGMRISAGPDSPHAEFGGATYYFCSDECRRQFLADPKGHVPADAGH